MASKTGLLSVAQPLVFQSEAGSMVARDIKEGSLLVEKGSPVPEWLRLGADSSLPGWSVIGKADSKLKKDLKDAGWTLFFVAGEVTAAGLGLGGALRRLAGRVKSQHFNCFEITRIARENFLGISRLRISGHARQLQNGLAFSGNLVTGNAAPGGLKKS